MCGTQLNELKHAADMVFKIAVKDRFMVRHAVTEPSDLFKVAMDFSTQSSRRHSGGLWEQTEDVMIPESSVVALSENAHPKRKFQIRNHLSCGPLPGPGSEQLPLRIE